MHELVKFHYLLVVLVFFVGNIFGEISDSELEKVPVVFATDNFPECRSKGDLFCRIHFSVKPDNNDSDVWRIIQETKNDKRYFNREFLYRFRCIPNIFDGQEEAVKLNATLKENQFLENFSLKANVDKVNCINYSKPVDLRTFDYVLMAFLVCYATLIIIATVIDSFHFRGKYIDKMDMFIKDFSVTSQWSDLTTPITDADYNNMKCLQGVRTYNMALVIAGHTLSSSIFSYVLNSKFVEDHYEFLHTRFTVYGGMHIVQTNFLISGWLNAKMIYKHMDTKKELKMGFIFKKVIMRYVRLLPPLAIIISFEMSNWSKVIVASPPLERVEADFKACQKNWWATLLLITNFLPSTEICNSGMWYLTNDFQMYILTLLMFFIMFKFNIGLKMIAFVMAIFWWINFYLLYSLNLTPSFEYNPENAKFENLFGSYNLYVQYTSIWINYSSYGVGLIFGYLYHKYRNYNVKVTKLMTITWFIVAFGLPIASIYISMFKYSRLTSAILGASLKPLYAIGVGIGLFGMIHGVGGIVKRICEWDLAELIARWSYSTFLIHFFVVFGRHYFAEDLLYITHTTLIQITIVDIVQSFSAGLLVHLIIERPLGYLVAGLFVDKAALRAAKEK